MATKYETKARKLLQAYFASHPDTSIPISQIINDLALYRISKASVYRNLSLLEQDGTLQKVAKEGSREGAYRYLKAGRCKEHLHLSCIRCGKTIHLDLPTTTSLITIIQNESSFHVDCTSSVIYGLCSSCNSISE